MDSASSIDVVLRYYDAINRNDLAAYDELFEPDVEFVVPGVEGDGYLTLRGIDATRGFDEVFAGAITGFTIEPLATAADDEGHVLSRNRVTGTHTGTLHAPGGDLPATGRTFDATYVGTFTVRGGRICAQQIYYDQVGLKLMLG